MPWSQATAATLASGSERKTLTEELAAMLAEHVRRDSNLLIFGGTGSGKTTLTNALASFIPDSEPVYVYCFLTSTRYRIA